MLRVLAIFTGIVITAAQMTNFCTNITDLTASSVCPESQITPHCWYINANIYSICQGTFPFETGINGENCAVVTNAYGCAFITKTISTDYTFCCHPFVVPSMTPTRTETATASATLSASASASASSSASVSVSMTASATASVTPSVTPTISDTPSVSYSNTPTPSPTASNTPTPSPTPSPTSTVTPTRSPTSSPSVSPNWASPPPLPPLTNISFSQVNQFINQISSYNPDVIQGTLLQVAAAAITNGSFSIATSSFNMTLKSLPPNATNTLRQDGVHVEIPPLPVEGGAASLIQWKTNPYQGTSEIVPDSSVVSISVIGTDGNKLKVSGLQTPISFNLPLTIKPNDPRFRPPPLYLVLCSVKKIMIQQGNAFIPFIGANQTTNTTWAVPCLLDSWQRVDCIASVQEFQCPTPVITYECLYWDINKTSWSGDGCTATVGSQSSITCACTHLTDFSSRIKAIVTSNIAVFNNAKNVYSESGLEKYAEWYGIFGGLGAGCVLLSCIVMYIDVRSRRRYIHSLLRNEEIVKIMKEIPRVPISAYDRLETLQNLHRAKKIEKPVRELNIFHRILQHHPFFQFIFRYDPRLTRVLRLMFICVIQFHSLFITALLYGFTYGDKGAMVWYDTAILAVITTALNIPVVNLLIWAFNRIGNYEFRQQFPILYNEYMRRSNFEKMALVYLNKIGDKPNVGSLVFKAPAVKVPEEYLVENGDLNELDAKDILKKMAREIERIDRSWEDYSGFWSIFPTHSWQASLALSGLFGWLGWCLNYLLLFAAANTRNVGHEVMKSWAASEITNIVVIQPLTIGSTVLLYILMNRYDKYIPTCIKKSKTVKSIPSLFYFSNPWNSLSQSTLTSEFAYIIFVKCGAFASHSEELSYAPVNAIVNEVGEEKTITEEARVKELYDAMKKAYQEINE